jgi:hypothetical protein
VRGRSSGHGHAGRAAVGIREGEAADGAVVAAERGKSSGGGRAVTTTAWRVLRMGLPHRDMDGTG